MQELSTRAIYTMERDRLHHRTKLPIMPPDPNVGGKKTVYELKIKFVLTYVIFSIKYSSINIFDSSTEFLFLRSQKIRESSSKLKALKSTYMGFILTAAHSLYYLPDLLSPVKLGQYLNNFSDTILNNAGLLLNSKSSYKQEMVAIFFSLYSHE